METIGTAVVIFGSALTVGNPSDIDVAYVGDINVATQAALAWVKEKGLEGIPLELHKARISLNEQRLVVIIPAVAADDPFEIILGDADVFRQIEPQSLPAAIRRLARGCPLPAGKLEVGLEPGEGEEQYFGGGPIALKKALGKLNDAGRSVLNQKVNPTVLKRVQAMDWDEKEAKVLREGGQDGRPSIVFNLEDGTVSTRYGGKFDFASDGKIVTQ